MNSITSTDKFIQLYVDTSFDLIKKMEVALQQLNQDPNNMEAVKDLHRAFHSLKGQSNIMDHKELGEFCLIWEQFLRIFMEKETNGDKSSIQQSENRLLKLPTALISSAIQTCQTAVEHIRDGLVFDSIQYEKNSPR